MLLPILSNDGWDIDVVAVHANESIVKREIGYITNSVCTLPASPGIDHERALAKALLLARFKDYDVIYLCGHFIAWRGTLSLLLPKIKKKLVYHNTDYFDPITYPFHTRMERLLCRNIDLYINDEFHRAYITRTYYGIKCPVIVAPPNLYARWPVPGCSAEMRRKIDGERSEAFILMNCGGFTPLRMIPELVTALSMLPERFSLVLTGGRPRDGDFLSLIKGLNLEERITWLPFLDFQEMMSYVANADLGVMLLANNDLGNYFGAEGRMTQYLACGLPLLASEHAGIESLVLRYGLGSCVDAQDYESIASGVLSIEEGVLSGRYSKSRIREAFLKYFSFEHWENEIKNAFNELVYGQPKQQIAPPKYPWMPSR
jgi:glycosyltransferase involved in cell wall biosynthesis